MFQIAYCLKYIYIYTFKPLSLFIFFPDLEQFLCLSSRGRQSLKLRDIIMLHMPQFVTKWHRDFIIQLLYKCVCGMNTKE